MNKTTMNKNKMDNKSKTSKKTVNKNSKKGQTKEANSKNLKSNKNTKSNSKFVESELGNIKISRGSGGETRQQADKDHPIMTTQQGTPISDNQNTLRQGAKGPALMEDFSFREKMFHFDHERIPERVVHARGYGAHGYFETYESLSDLTTADIFQRKGEKTPAFARFSTVAGNKGSADLARDVRGFAVKLYTDEGNWDIVGNNIPVFFIQDAMKFPDLVHSVKAAPDRGFPQAQSAHDNFWDFISLMPESMNMVMWIMSDRTIPRSLRFMEGFGVHTFRMINKNGESKYVKFHWKPKKGMQSVVWNEALKINGADPDFHRRDMWESIENKDYPEWELGLQIFDDKFADKFEFDILDPTKFIPEEEVPVKIVGRLVLDKLVDNFFAETEQVAFCTQNIVPGIDFTNDPLLQGRNFSYLDTQIKRLGGPNFTHLPINAPKCPFHNMQQDGHMAFTNPKGRVNYEPNSWTDTESPRESFEKGFKSFTDKSYGDKGRERSDKFSDHYSQASQFYISQNDVEKDHILSALSFELSKVKTSSIRQRMVSHILNIDTDLAKNLAKNLGMDNLPKPAEPAKQPNMKLKKSDSLSILKNPPKTFSGRKLGVLIAGEFDEKILNKIKSEAKKIGATVAIIAPTLEGEKGNKGTKISADEKVEGGPSVLFDSVMLLTSKDGATKLSKIPEVKDFLNDAYSHKKFIGYVEDSSALLEEVGLLSKADKGFSKVENSGDVDKFFESCRDLRFWGR